MIQWTLHYSRIVITYLYELREDGSALRMQIGSLKREPLPESVAVLSEPEKIYLLITAEHYVTYQLKYEEKLIRILGVERQ